MFGRVRFPEQEAQTPSYKLNERRRRRVGRRERSRHRGHHSLGDRVTGPAAQNHCAELRKPMSLHVSYTSLRIVSENRDRDEAPGYYS